MSVAPSCLADRIDRDTVRFQNIQRWHLHRGTVQWFICGPGADAMLACSAPDYEGRHPTIGRREAAVARKAIGLLDEFHRHSRNLGPADIQRVLNEAECLIPAHITNASDPGDLADLADLINPEPDPEQQEASVP
jgi:hypothetical protein